MMILPEIPIRCSTTVWALKEFDVKDEIEISSDASNIGLSETKSIDQ